MFFQMAITSLCRQMSRFFSAQRGQSANSQSATTSESATNSKSLDSLHSKTEIAAKRARGIEEPLDPRSMESFQVNVVVF